MVMFIVSAIRLLMLRSPRRDVMMQVSEYKAKRDAARKKDPKLIGSRLDDDLYA